MNPSNEHEGKSDENPFVLQGISSVDFERFMEALLPRFVIFKASRERYWVAYVFQCGPQESGNLRPPIT